MLARRLRFQREARALLDVATRTRRSPSGSSAGASPRRSSSASSSRRPPPSGRPTRAQLWSFPARFLAEFFDNHGMLELRGRPRWRDGDGRLAPLRRGARRARSATACALATPVRAIHRHPDHVTVKPRGRRARALRRGRSSPPTPTRRSAMLADATPREHEVLGAIPYQANEAVLHTDTRLLPRRRARVGELELPPARRAGRPPDRDLPHEPPAVARGRRAVLRDAQPHGRDRPGEGDPHDRVRAPVYTSAGMRAQRRHDEISGRRRTHFCGAYWGWGFHEDGVASAVRVAGALGGRDLVSDAQRAVRGHDPPPPLRGARARVPPPPRARSTSTSTSFRGLLGGRLIARRPGIVRFRRADYLGDPARAARRRRARARRAAHGRPTRAARCGSSPSRGRSGTASTR